MEQQVAQLPWSIFDSDCAEDWVKVKEEFQEAEAACTRATQEVTDACFRSRFPASIMHLAYQANQNAAQYRQLWKRLPSCHLQSLKHDLGTTCGSGC